MTEDKKNQKLLDARSAGKLVGYSSDYVTRLAREGKVEAIQTGRHWLVDIDSLKMFTLEVQAEKRQRAAKIREERKKELALASVGVVSEEEVENKVDDYIKSNQVSAWAQTVALGTCLFLFSTLFWFAFENDLNHRNLVAGFGYVVEDLKESLSAPLPDYLSQLASFAFVESKQDVARELPDRRTEGTSMDSNNSSWSSYEGIVIFGDDSVSSAEVDRIRDSFSDPVTVSFDDEDTGVITPIFKERSDDSYRFLLAPIRSGAE